MCVAVCVYVCMCSCIWEGACIWRDGVQSSTLGFSHFIFKIYFFKKMGVMAQTFNPSPWATKSGGSLEFETILVYIFKTQTNKKSTHIL